MKEPPEPSGGSFVVFGGSLALRDGCIVNNPLTARLKLQPDSNGISIPSG